MTKNIPNDEFEKRLREKLSKMTADQLLSISGIYELVSEEYNNEIIEEWESEQNYLEIEILQHTILYIWRDGEDREMDESNIEYIERNIKKGYNQGELIQYELKEDGTDWAAHGWWEIYK